MQEVEDLVSPALDAGNQSVNTSADNLKDAETPKIDMEKLKRDMDAFNTKYGDDLLDIRSSPTAATPTSVVDSPKKRSPTGAVSPGYYKQASQTARPSTSAGSGLDGERIRILRKERDFLLSDKVSLQRDCQSKSRMIAKLRAKLAQSAAVQKKLEKHADLLTTQVSKFRRLAAQTTRSEGDGSAEQIEDLQAECARRGQLIAALRNQSQGFRSKLRKLEQSANDARFSSKAPELESALQLLRKQYGELALKHEETIATLRATQRSLAKAEKNSDSGVDAVTQARAESEFYKKKEKKTKAELLQKTQEAEEWRNRNDILSHVLADAGTRVRRLDRETNGEFEGLTGHEREVLVKTILKYIKATKAENRQVKYQLAASAETVAGKDEQIELLVRELRGLKRLRKNS